MKLADIDYAIAILQYLHKHRYKLHKEMDIPKAIGGSHLYLMK